MCKSACSLLEPTFNLHWASELRKSDRRRTSHVRIQNGTWIGYPQVSSGVSPFILGLTDFFTVSLFNQSQNIRYTGPTARTVIPNVRQQGVGYKSYNREPFQRCYQRWPRKRQFRVMLCQRNCHPLSQAQGGTLPCKYTPLKCKVDQAIKVNAQLIRTQPLAG